MFDSRSGQFSFDGPNPGALGFDWPELQEKLKEVESLGRQYEEATREARDLDNGRREAEAKDSKAYAHAIREGGKDPGPKNVQKLEKDLAALDRRRDALQIATREAGAELNNLIVGRRREWRTEVQERMPDAKRQLSEAVAAVREARAHLHALQGLGAWLQEPQRGYSKDAGNVTQILHLTGQPVRVEPALEALEAEADGAA